MGEKHCFYERSVQYNTDSKGRTQNRYKFGFQWLEPHDLDEYCYQKLSALKCGIEESYKHVESQIENVKKIALDFVKDPQQQVCDIRELYKDHGQKHCKIWHDFQKKMDQKFSEIAISVGFKFSCDNNSDYCPIYCYCCEEKMYCHDHKTISYIYMTALRENRRSKSRAKRRGSIFEFYFAHT